MSQARIVVVEDNTVDILLLRDALSKAEISFSLDQYLNGEEAMRAFSSMTEVPDLILLDLNLPRLHGFEVLRAIREHSVLAHARVAIFTTSRAPGDRLESEKLGADAYIVKPPGYEEFLTRVGGAIKKLLEPHALQPGAADDHVLASGEKRAQGNRRQARQWHVHRQSHHGSNRLGVPINREPNRKEAN